MERQKKTKREQQHQHPQRNGDDDKWHDCHLRSDGLGECDVQPETVRRRLEHVVDADRSYGVLEEEPVVAVVVVLVVVWWCAGLNVGEFQHRNTRTCVPGPLA